MRTCSSPVRASSSVPPDRGRKSRHDAREDDDGYAVADAPLAHLFTEPHEENRARNEGGDGRDSEPPARVDDHRQRARLLRFQGESRPRGTGTSQARPSP